MTWPITQKKKCTCVKRCIPNCFLIVHFLKHRKISAPSIFRNTSVLKYNHVENMPQFCNFVQNTFLWDHNHQTYWAHKSKKKYWTFFGQLPQKRIQINKILKLLHFSWTGTPITTEKKIIAKKIYNGTKSLQ